MSFVVVISIALAGCGDDSGPADGSTCPETINEGDPCPPTSCHIEGYPCGCGAGNTWSCPHPDMTVTHD